MLCRITITLYRENSRHSKTASSNFLVFNLMVPVLTSQL